MTSEREKYERDPFGLRITEIMVIIMMIENRVRELRRPHRINIIRLSEELGLYKLEDES